MAETSPLRRRMIEDMTVLNLSPATQRSYVHAAAKFSRFFGRSPGKLTLEDVRTYQVHLASKGVAWSSLNQTVAALRISTVSRSGWRRFPSGSPTPRAAASAGGAERRRGGAVPQGRCAATAAMGCAVRRASARRGRARLRRRTPPRLPTARREPLRRGHGDHAGQDRPCARRVDQAEAGAQEQAGPGIDRRPATGRTPDEPAERGFQACGEPAGEQRDSDRRAPESQCCAVGRPEAQCGDHIDERDDREREQSTSPVTTPSGRRDPPVAPAEAHAGAAQDQR